MSSPIDEIPAPDPAAAPPLGHGELPPPSPSMSRALFPGLATVALITAAALAAGHALPEVGAPVFAVVFGIVVAALWPRPTRAPGAKFAGKRLLQLAVVLLGTLLSGSQLLHTGVDSLPLIATTLAASAIAAIILARILSVRRMLATLIAVGTAICGASAIAASATVLDPDEADTSYAVATIFAFNVAAVLLFPPIGHMLGLSQHGFGLWAGTAINDTSSVVAAATVYGAAATRFAVTVKLTRALMIVPVTIALGIAHRRAHTPSRGATPRTRVTQLVPMFIILFVLAACANTLGLIPHAAQTYLHTAANVCIAAALAGIGLSTSLGAMRRAGLRPLALGAGIWAVVAVTSLLVQAAGGTLR